MFKMFSLRIIPSVIAVFVYVLPFLNFALSDNNVEVSTNLNLLSYINISLQDLTLLGCTETFSL